MNKVLKISALAVILATIAGLALYLSTAHQRASVAAFTMGDKVQARFDAHSKDAQQVRKNLAMADQTLAYWRAQHSLCTGLTEKSNSLMDALQDKPNDLRRKAVLDYTIETFDICIPIISEVVARRLYK